jgi:2-dehydropantoate 2-reductase
MRIAVVGAGGVGGFFGARLAKSGADVTFIARGKTLEALRSHGIRIDSIAGDFSVHPVKAISADANAQFDVVLLAVKAWQVPEAANEIAHMLHATSVVVPLENGIDAPDHLIPIVGRERVAGGLCAIVSFIVEPGVIKHAGADPIVMFGELDNSRSARLDALRDAFRRAGINTEIPPDIHRSMWSKFAFITPMSGFGAISRVPVGAWRTVPQSRRLVEDAVKEVIAVATARGVKLDDDLLARTMQRYDILPPESTASLQRDVAAGKPSEIEAQIGAVVRLGRESGVPTPIHDVIYAALLPGAVSR